MTSPTPDPRTVTRALNELVSSGTRAPEEIYVLVYQELRRLAAREMRREGDRRTFDTTALVNEAYMRLTQNGSGPWENRWHFFGAAARAMRRILIDSYRRRRRRDAAHRHAMGRGEHHDPNDVELGPDMVALDAALSELEQLDSRLAEVVMLRYFAGLTVEQVADVMGSSERTVKRDWRAAKAWLYRRIAEQLDEEK